MKRVINQQLHSSVYGTFFQDKAYLVLIVSTIVKGHLYNNNHDNDGVVFGLL